MPGDSKTEKATPKKRTDERKKGNVFFSKDLLTITSLLGAFYGLKILFPFMHETIREYLLKYIDYAGSITSLTEGTIQGIVNESVVVGAKLIAPILLITVAIAIIVTGVQTKFVFTGKNMAPQFGRLSPLKGIKNLFSIKNAMELLKNLIKISILFYILYSLVKGELINIARTMDMDVTASTTYVLNMVMKMIFKIGIVFIAVSAFDYLYQWWDYERKIKMSKQETKEEYKQMEGSPEIKGKIREIQRQRARSRMMQDVPKADVIIRNPTHFAVALKYDITNDNAPVLLAKGQDELALRIIKTAKESGIYILENKPLARAIYATTQIGSEIPEEYYSTVAEILVYVYRLNHKSVT
ncbi:MAG: flagellar biosynthesis protein FlhB [Lachnospiraceae bacterium]|nr:flagellar biosynthesis protein FlhB [Lachnospiraceae bacterium]